MMPMLNLNQRYFCHGLAPEAADKFAVGILFPRQAYVHEVDMPVAMPVGVVDGVPYSHRVGMQIDVALSARGEMP